MKHKKFNCFFLVEAGGLHMFSLYHSIMYLLYIVNKIQYIEYPMIKNIENVKNDKTRLWPRHDLDMT